MNIDHADKSYDTTTFSLDAQAKISKWIEIIEVIKKEREEIITKADIEVAKIEALVHALNANIMALVQQESAEAVTDAPKEE